MKKKDLILQLEGGEEVNLKDVLAEATAEQLKEMGVIGEDGKVALKGLPQEIKTEAQEKLESIDRAANFVKFVTVPGSKHKEMGVKAIDTTTGSFGHSVPVELSAEIIRKKQKINAIRGRAFQFEMAGKFDLPSEGTGVTGYWVSENAAVTESAPNLGKTSLDDWYLAALIKAPWKLLQTSSVTIVEYISTLAAKALGETEETAFVGGDGSSKPSGFRGTAGVGSVAQVSGSVGGFAWSDVVNLFFTLNQKYRRNAQFLTSPAGLKLLMNLKDTQNRPLFPVGVPIDSVLNKPLIESDDIPANLGAGTNETEIWLADLSYYWIKDGQQMEMTTQDVIENLQTKILVFEAVDGKMTLPEAAAKLTAVK